MSDVNETETEILRALSWIAVRSDDPTAVLRALALADVRARPV
jgi:hypothetical protein